MRKSRKKPTIKNKKRKKQSPLRKYTHGGPHSADYGGYNPALDTTSWSSQPGQLQEYLQLGSGQLGTSHVMPQSAASIESYDTGSGFTPNQMSSYGAALQGVGRGIQGAIPTDDRTQPGQLTEEGIANYQQQQALNQTLSSTAGTALTTAVSAAGPYAAIFEGINQAVVKPIRKGTTHIEARDGKPTEVPDSPGIGTMNAVFKPQHEHDLETMSGWFDKDKSSSQK